MATLHEIQSVMSGFPRNLTWAAFRPVAQSPSPPMLALTASSFHMGPWRAALHKGEYRVRGFQIAVSLTGTASWATTSGRTDALLRHEQGHYDITGLVARDLARKLLDLDLDASVVAALKGAGRNAAQRLRFAQQQFQRSVDQFGREASALLAKLQTNPATGTDGIYDKQTGHGVNTAAQTTWDNRLAQMKKGDEYFGLALAMAGVV